VSGPFVWFDLRTKDAEASRNFYEELLGWNVSDPIAGDGGVRAHGSEQPWASVVPDGGENIGWFPYVQIADLETATERAKERGGGGAIYRLEDIATTGGPEARRRNHRGSERTSRGGPSTRTVPSSMACFKLCLPTTSR
jgi:predicted enzyme related to lactoylglutathione lyase